MLDFRVQNVCDRCFLYLCFFLINVLQGEVQLEGNGDRTGKFEIFQLRGNADQKTFLPSKIITGLAKLHYLCGTIYVSVFVRGDLNYKPGGFWWSLRQANKQG